MSLFRKKGSPLRATKVEIFQPIDQKDKAISDGPSSKSELSVTNIFNKFKRFFNNETLTTVVNSFIGAEFKLPKLVEVNFQKRANVTQTSRFIFISFVFVQVVLFCGYDLMYYFGVFKSETEEIYKDNPIFFILPIMYVSYFIFVCFIIGAIRHPISMQIMIFVKLFLLCSEVFILCYFQHRALMRLYILYNGGCFVHQGMNLSFHFFFIFYFALLIVVMDFLTDINLYIIFAEVLQFSFLMVIEFICGYTLQLGLRKRFLELYVLEKQKLKLISQAKKNRFLLNSLLPQKIVKELSDQRRIREIDVMSNGSNKKVKKTKKKVQIERDSDEDEVEVVMVENGVNNIGNYEKYLKFQQANIIHYEYSNVTVMFFRIFQFEKIIATFSAKETIMFLNEIFVNFDIILNRHKLYRVKTIHSMYMVTSGFPNENKYNSSTIESDLKEQTTNTVTNESRSFFIKRNNENLYHAINCAFDILKVVREKLIMALNVRVLCGLDCGNVIGGVLGHATPIFDAWGNACNISARLCKVEMINSRSLDSFPTLSENENSLTLVKNAIYITEKTYAKLNKEWFRVEHHGGTEMKLKGIGITRVYTLVRRQLPFHQFMTELKRKRKSPMKLKMKKKRKNFGLKMVTSNRIESEDIDSDESSMNTLSDVETIDSITSSNVSTSSSSAFLFDVFTSIAEDDEKGDKDLELFKINGDEKVDEEVLEEIPDFFLNSTPSICVTLKFINLFTFQFGKTPIFSTCSCCGIDNATTDIIYSLNKLNKHYNGNSYKKFVKSNRIIIFLGIFFFHFAFVFDLFRWFSQLEALESFMNLFAYKMDSFYLLLFYRFIIGSTVVFASSSPIYTCLYSMNRLFFESLTLFSILSWITAISFCSYFYMESVSSSYSFHIFSFTIVTLFCVVIQGIHVYSKLVILLYLNIVVIILFVFREEYDIVNIMKGYVTVFGTSIFVVFVLFFSEVSSMEQYFWKILNLKKKVIIDEEKKRTNDILLSILPRYIIKQLAKERDESMKNTVIGKNHDIVGIMHCDLFEFTDLTQKLSSFHLLVLLNMVFGKIDEFVDKYELTKMCIQGDDYMICSGCPLEKDNHLKDLAECSLDVSDFVREFQEMYNNENDVKFNGVRIGIHCGPCCSGLIGRKTKISFDIFGKVVLDSKFFESTGSINLIHVSEKFKSHHTHRKFNNYVFELRKKKLIFKGKPIKTYWLSRA